MLSSYWVIDRLPLWLLLGGLLFLTYPVHRWLIIFTEGPARTLCLSESGAVGDWFLALFITLAASILQRQQTELTEWFATPLFHAATLVVVAAVVIGMYYMLPKGRWTDGYHGMFIAPMYLFFTLPALPLVFSGRATFWEQILGVMLLLAFAATFAWDVCFQLLDQPAAWKRLGIVIPEISIHELWQKR